MPKRQPSILSRTFILRALYLIFILICFVQGSIELLRQRHEDQLIRDLARRIVTQADAHDSRAKTLALRNYLRANVRFQEAAYLNRPFLRATAWETISSGQGYCGEVSRAFICMAKEVGVPAQRIEFAGRNMHVVAEAFLPSGAVIVDSQNPPQVASLEPLDRVMTKGRYDEYFSINLERFHLYGFITRLRLRPSFVTDWLEKPHLILATVWWATGLFALFCFTLSRIALFYLHQCGWTRNTGSSHTSSHPSTEESIQVSL